jgi:Zn-dependent peptidase ImmA (M78 family)
MPTSEVTAEVRRLVDRGQTPNARFIADLAIYFDVSEQAMEYRLVHLGLWRQI